MPTYKWVDQAKTTIIQDGVTIFPAKPENREYQLYKADDPDGTKILPPEAVPVDPDAVIRQANFGTTVPANFQTQVQDGINTLQTYLDTASPTGAQTVQAIKLLIRLNLFLLRRMFS
jgi:hypothetical protein